LNCEKSIFLDVRSALFIILALQVLTSGQTLAELMKVVNLLDHFRMHVKSGEVKDLAEFIQLHYFDPVHEQSDPSHHKHLPLQQVTPHISSVFSYVMESVCIPLPEFATFETPAVHTSGFLPQTHPLSVFQPPRA
jgi:hypothetical protein